MVLGWALGPDYDQHQIWHSSQSNPEQLNVVNYRNPTVDKSPWRDSPEYNRGKDHRPRRGSCKAPSIGINPTFSSRSAGHVRHVEGQLSDSPPGRPGRLDHYAGGNDQNRLGLLHGLVLPTGVCVIRCQNESTARFLSC